MDMAYRILWVEDNDNWFRANLPSIREMVEEDHGFKLFVRQAKGAEDMPDMDLWRSFDIVLMDLNLVGQDGAELIRRLREQEVYTDVVFYSQSGSQAVRLRAQELSLDGIFCAGRDGGVFADKVRAVIGNTIKKVQDVNNLRGLVVAEASEVDVLLHEVIELHHKGLGSDDATQFMIELLGKIAEDAQGSVQDLDGYKEAALVDLLDSRHATAFQLWKAVVRVLKKMQVPNELLVKIKAYQVEVMNPRNDLAHSIAEYDEQVGTTTLRNRKRPDKVLEFSDEWCRDMRKTLLEHRQALTRLKELLAQGQTIPE